MMELGPERDNDNKKVFDLLFAKYGFFDYTVYSYDIKGNKGWFRIRGYHDGAWLEGYDADYVIYWGA